VAIYQVHLHILPNCYYIDAFDFIVADEAAFSFHIRGLSHVSGGLWEGNLTLPEKMVYKV